MNWLNNEGKKKNMSALERRAAAERGGSIALELDRIGAAQLAKVWGGLSDTAKKYIETFSGCPGDFYVTFGNMEPDEINETVDEWEAMEK